MWTHSECGHEKKFEVSPNGHCNIYRMQSDQDHHIDGHCNRNLVAHHINTIVAPSLCVTCFRQVEEDISTVFDDQVNALEQDHASLFADLLVETHPRERRLMEKQLDIIRERMGDIKLGRKVAIANFRSGQGVWPDGCGKLTMQAE